MIDFRFLLLIQPADGGLIYTETNLSHYFPEPLNTLTSCFFLLLAVYWILKLKGYSRKHSFLSICSWLLLIGSIGGTVYHGLRRYPIFIPMDWVPILLLCLMASAWFWTKILGSSIASIGVFVLFFFIQYLAGNVYLKSNSHFANNVNYALMALMVLVPVIVFLKKTRFQHGIWVFVALLAFSLALFFRVADKWGLLPTGTHFLWHTFGALATSCMFMFIFRLNEGMRLVYSKPMGSSTIKENYIRNSY